MLEDKIGDRALLKKFRILESSIVALAAIGQLLVMIAEAGSGNLDHGHPPLIAGLIALLSMLLLLLNLNVDLMEKSQRNRLLFITFQISLATIASLFGFLRFTTILIFSAACKAYLCLEFRTAIKLIALGCLCVAAIVFHHFSLQGMLPSVLGLNSGASSTVPSSSSDGIKIVALLLQAIVDSMIVSVVFFLVMMERQSRLKAVALAEKVEELGKQMERNRIARDIHDHLGHRIVSLCIQLEVALKLFDKDREESRRALKLAKDVADQSIDDIRDAVLNIRDPGASLSQSLMTLAEETKNNIKGDVEIDLDEKCLDGLDAPIAREIYSLVKECLNNATKHSGANSIKISAHRRDDKIVLSITDDGEGFDPQEVEEGFGMTSLRERIQNLGGSIILDSAPAKGTVVSIEIRS
ncbi:hypothetical protein GC174_12155 [bacterium]|nr:hypothetical protein [bacterium]